MTSFLAYLRLGSGIQHSFGRRIITTVSMSSRQYVVTSIPTSSYVVLPAWLYIYIVHSHSAYMRSCGPTPARYYSTASDRSPPTLGAGP